MERMKQLWNRYNMRAVAMLLAVVTFLNVPFSAYASVSTPSDMDIMGESVEGEYMPDNIISRYEKSFEYCPETPPNPRSRIVISGSLVAAFVALLAVCGIYVGNNTSLVQDIINGFDTYLRRTAGNVKSVMEAWAAFLTIEAGVTISGIKQLLPYLRDYLKTYFTGYGAGGFEYSYSSGTGVIDDGPFAPALIEYMEKYPHYQYAFSLYSYSDSNKLIDVAYDTSHGTALAFCLIGSTLQIVYLDEDDKYTFYHPLRAGRTYFPADNSYTYDPTIRHTSFNVLPTGFTDAQSSALANCLPLPLFKNTEYARGYVQFGKMDGLIEIGRAHV